MMYGGSCHRDEPPPPPNGSQAVSLLLRLCTLVLALTSAVVMAATSDCAAAVTGAGVVASIITVSYSRYGAFAYLVGSNIAAAILEAAAIYLQALQLAKGTGGGGEAAEEETVVAEDDDEEEGGKLIGILLSVVIDVLVLALLFSATGAAYAGASAYAAQIGACVRFGVQVERSKLLSLAACAAVALAAVAKDVPLPFNVPPVK